MACGLVRFLAAACWASLLACCRAASKPFYYAQFVDHFRADTRVFNQRYYQDETYFKGPGSPIILIMGGEGGIPPEVGIYYPWVQEVLAKEFGALVLELEHRFYGASLPFGDPASFEREALRLLSSQQALADAAHFVRSQQALRKCTARGTKDYCPVLTIGGSYPGFLSAMMRLRYPDVVDMAYAASAPMRFYTQEVGQYDYYSLVTSSAEKSLPGCASAVRTGFDALESFLANSSLDEIAHQFSICTPLPTETPLTEVKDNLLFLLEQTFANLNMANYPADASTGLHKVCEDFVSAKPHGLFFQLAAMTRLLNTFTHQSTTSRLQRGFPAQNLLLQHDRSCFNLSAHMPAGDKATARCGDWSGCGSGRDGEMWDYQTCSFEVEHIGFGTPNQMFPDKSWSIDWLQKHCAARFGTTPQPEALNELWGFNKAGLASQTSRLLFTNGLNDGWSVGGFLEDIAPEKGIVSLNLPGGAHHSDLAHFVESTPEVDAVRKQAIKLVTEWLKEVSVTVTEKSIMV